MTAAEICKRLSDAGIETAKWDTELLLEHFCGVPTTLGLLDLAQDFDSPELADAVARRCAREPLQYLLGEWDFYRQRYRVTPDCLIPRSDTEILVEEAIRRLPRGAYFLDLCTGSGCIAVSTLAERTDTHALAVDLSEGAIAVAEENARKNGVAERFTVCRDDLLAPSAELRKACRRADAILSNPPYIRSDVVPTLSREVLHEPEMALDGGEDGLVFYRALLSLAREHLKEGAFCLLEIGYDQGDALRQLAEQHGFSCEIKRDLGGCDRVAILARHA